VVVELAAVVALQSTDRALELGRYSGEEVSEGGKRVGLQPKGESLKKIGVVVQNDQVVFVAGEAKDRRRPDSRDHSGQDQRPEQPWTWKWKKEDESGGRADKNDRGAQKSPEYGICLSGWKVGT
jgi:hypothetical protein